MLGIAVGGALGAASALMTYAVRSPSSSILAPSVYRGPRSRRALGLTFDDGPGERTLEMLELLDRYRARATFFQCGVNIERHPDVARAVAKAGHEIGNHSFTHPRFHFRSSRFIEDELTRAQSAILNITGVSPALFRAPYGIRWMGMRAAQRRLNLLGVMWTVIGHDWRLPAGAIVERVLKGTGNGAIICLHDGREIQAKPDIGPTVEAVRRLMPVLRDQGFTFETVSQLICPRN